MSSVFRAEAPIGNTVNKNQLKSNNYYPVVERGKPEYLGKDLSKQRRELTTLVGHKSGNRTQTTLVGGDGSNHCAIPA